MIFDVHAHIEAPIYDRDKNVVIKRAQDAHVIKILNIGWNVESSIKCIKDKTSNLLPAVGIHPSEINTSLEDIKKIEELSDAAFAIGEIGLDYYHKDFDKDLQEKFFEKQIEIALNKQKPVIIHSRKAEARCIEITATYHSLKGIYHSFTGEKHLIKRILDQGFYISFNGMIFKSTNTAELVQYVPINKLLVETDAPYLTPPPQKGRNEPAYIVHTFKRIASIKKIDIDHLKEIVFKNSTSLLNA